MEGATTVLVFAAVALLACLWGVLNWVWIKPKRLEKKLKLLGFKGNPYRLLIGDMIELGKMSSDATSKPMDVSDDYIAPRVIPYSLHLINKYGKKCYAWMGPRPMVFITDCECVKEVLSKNYLFQKLESNSLNKKLAEGLVSYEKEKWAKHRKLISPAFYTGKLKLMQPAFLMSCCEMVSKWEEIMVSSGNGSCELDVWPHIQNLSRDVISRTAFGSSYEEGKKIFQLQREQLNNVMKSMSVSYIPGWRFVPTKRNRRINVINKEVKSMIQAIIEKRMKAMNQGEENNNDLLGILLESNLQEIKQGEKEFGMSNEDVIEECKLFYFAGQETTAAMIVWTMVLLSKFQDWQARAREEVLQVYGDEKPDFEELNNLKVVMMILYESLRLYTPGAYVTRRTVEETKLGETVLPAGVMLGLPLQLLHVDSDVWAEDAKEFKPERFREGVTKATNGKYAFLPFGGGPRVCIGQNFAMSEVKMAIAMILQRFSFELSPSYTHAPHAIGATQPQHGAPLILHKL